MPSPVSLLPPPPPDGSPQTAWMLWFQQLFRMAAALQNTMDSQQSDIYEPGALDPHALLRDAFLLGDTSPRDWSGPIQDAFLQLSGDSGRDWTPAIQDAVLRQMDTPRDWSQAIADLQAFDAWN